MKILKIFSCAIALMLCLSAFAACNDDNGGETETDPVYHTVKFTETEGGVLYTERQVKSGGTVSKPSAPTKAGYIFDGWYKGNVAWSFDQPVKSDMILAAHWISAESLFEHSPTGDGKTTVITKMKSARSTVNIPSVIGGYTVIGIGEGVFSEETEPPLTEVIIPAEVTSIGAEAFKDCDGVSITIEGALDQVGEFAFYGCNGLKSVKFKDGMTSISAYAFASTALTQVILPQSVTLIDENAFDGCSSLLSVVMSAENTQVCNSAFNGTGVKILYLYGNDAQIADFLENSVASKNESILDTKIYVYSEAHPTENTEYNGFWYLDGDGRTKIWK